MDKVNVFVMNGCSNHSLTEREKDDFYATNPIATNGLLQNEFFDIQIPVLEPCAGEGHISKILIEKGYNVVSYDLYDRGFCKSGVNFLDCTQKFSGNIITNPPYKEALKFLRHAYDILEEGYKVAFFLRLAFLEGKERRKFFDNNPPKTILVSTSRIHGCKGGIIDKNSSAIAYMWIVMEKGYKGKTELNWFN